MSTAGVCSLVIRSFSARNKKDALNISLSMILVLSTVSVILATTGFWVARGNAIDIKNLLFFYFIVLVLMTVMFIFIKIWALPLTLLLLFFLFFLLNHSFKEFRPIKEGEEITITVLKAAKEKAVIELNQKGYPSDFFEVNSEGNNLKIAAVTVNPCLFMLSAFSYYKFYDLADSSAGTELPFYLKPFTSLNISELPQLNMKTLYRFEITINGGISVSASN